MTSEDKLYISPALLGQLIDQHQTHVDNLISNGKGLLATSDDVKFDVARLNGQRALLDFIWTKLDEDNKNGFTTWAERQRTLASRDRRAEQAGQTGGVQRGKKPGKKPQPTGFVFKPTKHGPEDRWNKHWWKFWG